MNALQEMPTPIPMPDLIDGAGEDPSRGAAARSAARIQFLRDLIAEYNRITGRTEPADIPLERWQQFRELLPAKAGASR